jgi:hypothetical protein
MNEKELGLPQAMMEDGEAVKLDQVGENVDPQQGDERIFPGGPTFNELEGWKSQFGGEIYMTEFDDESAYIWRPIKRKEYKDISKIQGADQWYKEERICEKCVLFPKNYSYMAMTNGKAGTPSLLSELILEKSGFVAKTGAMKLS